MAGPIVTLTTDFGTVDGYVGAMKGVILRGAPGAVLVDVTHDLPRQDVTAAAHALANCVPFFPPGSIHVAVVDPGVGTARKAIILVDREQLFVGPDNGIFSLIAPRPQHVFEIAEPGFVRERPSATFHGRDVFAMAAAALASGAAPEEAGPPVVLRGQLPPLVGADHAAVYRVQHVDAFGNLITNIAGGAVPAGARLRVSGRDIAGLSRTYQDVASGELLAYVGSRGTVEIGVREGNAGELLGARRGTVVEVLPPSGPSGRP